MFKIYIILKEPVKAIVTSYVTKQTMTLNIKYIGVNSFDRHIFDVYDEHFSESLMLSSEAFKELFFKGKIKLDPKDLDWEFSYCTGYTISSVEEFKETYKESG